MDLAGGAFAAQQAQGRVATVSVDAMRFLRPVTEGVFAYVALDEEGKPCELDRDDARAMG